MVNESSKIVVLDVRRTNVPVLKSMLDISSSPPEKWSVVQWHESQLGARRASEANLGLTYAVCPACGERSPIVPPDANEMTCEHCRGSFALDWENPC